MRRAACIIAVAFALGGCGTTGGESTDGPASTTTEQGTPSEATTTEATTTTAAPTTTTTIPHSQALKEMEAEIARACTEAVETLTDPKPEWRESWAPYSTSQEVAQQAQECVDSKWAELKEVERQRQEEERRAEEQRRAEEEAARGTASQQNAKAMAADYLDSQSFSRTGLIGQLEYEGFSNADATWGVDALGVDWNEQAARMAADYLDSQPFSRSGLIDQLVYEGFTQAQAEYGVSTTGL